MSTELLCHSIHPLAKCKYCLSLFFRSKYREKSPVVAQRLVLQQESLITDQAGQSIFIRYKLYPVQAMQFSLFPTMWTEKCIRYSRYSLYTCPLQPTSVIYMSIIADIRYIGVRYSRYSLYTCPLLPISVIYVSVIADIRYIRVRYSQYPL